jgi:hypothetical protein
MFSSKKLRTRLLLASAALLSTSPLAAAIRTKASAPAVKTRPPVSAAHSNSSKTASHTVSHKAAAVAATSRHGQKASLKTVTVTKPKFRGQQAIDSARTLEIQQALIREHYLGGEATGQWDQSTREALIRFQGDNHWQTKILPDARALIKLGLGPVQQNLLNPETAAMSTPNQAGLGRSSQGGSN